LPTDLELFERVQMTLDFIIIGAEKSGTTLLVELLRRSPSVALPAHEVRYFRDPFFPDRELPDSHFSDADRGKLRGIKHPSYLGRANVPARIKAHSPDVKIIAILRDPIERTIASYLHYFRHGQIPTLSPNVGIPILLDRPDSAPKYRDIIEFGHYSKYLSLYLEHFRRDQLLVLEFEQFVRQPTAINAVTDFLGIAPISDTSISRINEGTYDWGECMRRNHRAKMSFIYDEGMNIIGSRQPSSLVPAHDYPPEAVSIIEPVRDLLRSRYEKESEALTDLGLLSPKHWPSPVMPEPVAKQHLPE
jgi:hypothetical protein